MAEVVCSNGHGPGNVLQAEGREEGGSVVNYRCKECGSRFSYNENTGEANYPTTTLDEAGDEE